MNVEEVIKYFESKKPDRKVVKIHQPSKDYVVIQAPFRKSFFGPQSAPNSYLMTRDKKIMPINPMDDFDRFSKLTNDAYLIYDILKGND